jgi:predicted anti-sigma-YlaC factor YlaD
MNERLECAPFAGRERGPAPTSAAPGNHRAGSGDYHRMKCERFREALSARLDGEEDPTERPGLDAHLAGCAACQRWAAEAAAVTRMIRVASLTAVADTEPDLEALHPAEPARSGRARTRLAGALRVSLGLLGAAQFVLGMAQVAGVQATMHAPAARDAALGTGHLSHEAAAWNVAVGAGFMVIALRRARPAGALPMLTAFLGFLGLLSIQDFAAGRVDGGRLLSHGFVLAGYLVTLALSRPRLDPGEPPAYLGDPPGPSAAHHVGRAAAPPAAPRLRLIQGEARAA